MGMTSDLQDHDHHGYDYDAIVVGARCAGSPTAMLLARQGHRVLMVDRATFPSDTVSTQLLHPPAIAALRRWDVLDDVLASGCPPIDSYTFDFGPVTVTGTAHAASDGGRTSYAPRRIVLDKVLVDGAVDAGVEMWEGFTVDEVVIEGDTVVGIRGRGASGEKTAARAKVVVGADGVNSRVAAAVDAEAYNCKPVLEWAAYSYWQGLPVNGMETIVRPDRGFAAMPTNDDLTLVLVGWPADEAAAYRSDVEGNFLATLELSPEFAERVHAGARVDRFHGGGVPNVMRIPYGPGWVLVGDAGYSKDPITAQGMLDAFADAERIAAGLHGAFTGEITFQEAMSAAHAARDAHAMPIYEFTTSLATLHPPPPEMQQLLAAIGGNQAAMDAFMSVVAGTLSPIEFFDPANMERLLSPTAV
jgi:2-polyprenyl-6-methoxyphenol hydroxylase-like FAD-dependent oxidoreductase